MYHKKICPVASNIFKSMYKILYINKLNSLEIAQTLLNFSQSGKI